MEIHAPHAPLHSLKDFLIALGTITAGVLIALSIESLLEWNHYRRLVHEARAMISREVADNLKDVDVTLKDLEAQRRDIVAATQFADELIATGKSNATQVNVGAALADLSSASWESAERTGALAHMEYDEVRKWAQIYTFQGLYSAQQRKVLERAAAAMTIFGREGGPDKWPRGDLELFRQQVLALGADVTMQERLGRRLTEHYRKALQR